MPALRHVDPYMWDSAKYQMCEVTGTSTLSAVFRVPRAPSSVATPDGLGVN